MAAYYNEIDPYAALWLRNLIEAGHIAPGEVDERSIVDVRPADLAGFDQCHFFAGIGGWSYALRLAGVADDFPVWTGSCPCQPFSVAGKRKGFDDARHLWPEFRRLIAECRPTAVLGEQVSSASAWLAGVRGDLEALGYAVGAIPIEAASVGAAHKRDRYWFVADAGGDGLHEQRGELGIEESTRLGRHQPDDSRRSSRELADADGLGPGAQRSERGGQQRGSGGDPRDRDLGDARDPRLQGRELGEARHGDGHRPEAHGPTAQPGGAWGSADWLVGADGKARRVEPGIRLLAHGIPARVGKLRAYGNAIVPQVAAEFIGAWLDATPDTGATQ